MHAENLYIRMEAKWKTILIQNDPHSKEHLQNHNVPTNGVENKGGDLLRIDEPRNHSPTNRKDARDTGELLNINHILNESKTRWKNQALARIDNKKAYDMVLQSWILHCLKCIRYPTELYSLSRRPRKTGE